MILFEEIYRDFEANFLAVTSLVIETFLCQILLFANAVLES